MSAAFSNIQLAAFRFILSLQHLLLLSFWIWLSNRFTQVCGNGGGLPLSMTAAVVGAASGVGLAFFTAQTILGRLTSVVADLVGIWLPIFMLITDRRCDFALWAPFAFSAIAVARAMIVLEFRNQRRVPGSSDEVAE